MKEETRVAGPWEFGKIPLSRNSKTDWALVKQAAKAGDYDKIPDNILVTHYSNIQKLYKDNCKVTSSSTVRGIYIHGDAGIGKVILPDLYFLVSLCILRILTNILMAIRTKLLLFGMI